MDGTLVRGTAAPVLLAAALDRSDTLIELDAQFAAGALTSVEFGRALHEMWGVVAPETVRRAFAAAPLLANIREVLAAIPARDEHACLITLSPDYFAEQFLDFGFDAVFGSRFPRDAATPLDETAILTPRDQPPL